MDFCELGGGHRRPPIVGQGVGLPVPVHKGQDFKVSEAQNDLKFNINYFPISGHNYSM